MFNKPVKSFYQYYTESVAVGKTVIDESFPKTDEGIICIPSDTDKEIKLFLRNPQDYSDLVFNYEFGDSAVQSIVNSISDSVKIQRLESNSTYCLIFSKTFLESIDGTDSNSLNGTVKISQTSTLRSFEDFQMEYIANTKPVTIRNPIFQLTQNGTGSYVVCFFIPVLSNTIHKDINRIIISGTTYYLSDDRSVFYTDAEKTNASDLIKTSATIYPLTDGGLSFSDYVTPEGYRPVYYFTNQPMSEDTVLYDITLKDKTGLESTLSISNKAEVLTPVIIKSDDYSLLTDNSTIPSKEKLETATVRFEHNGLTKSGSSVTDVLVNYSVLNGTEIIDSGTKSLPCSIEVPYGQSYTITATAQKNYYLDSSENSVSGINIKHSPVYYVSNTGSDTSLGSLGKPFATIQNCIETIKSEISNYGIYTDGYTINVLSNLERTADTAPDAPFVDINYYQDFTLTIRGTDADNNPVNRTLDAKGTEADPHQVMRYVASNIVTTFTFNLENLTLTGGYTKTQNGAGLHFSQEQGRINATLKNVTVTNNIINASDKYGAGIYFGSGYENGSFLTLEDCTVSDNKNMVSSGGGIYQSTNLSNLSPLTLKGTTTVRNNTAKQNAGIYCNDLLDIQSKDVTIVNNKSTVDGSSAGVFANKQINISGATIKDNFAGQEGSVPQASNLKLASGIKINVTGPLTGSEIHVTPGDVPTAGNPVVITSGYSDFNAGVDPTEYFIADSFGITYSNDKNEAAVAISSGSYEEFITNDISFESDNPVCVQGTDTQFTIKAILNKGLETEKDITDEIEAAKWTLSLYENGDPMKQDTFTANANSITVKQNVPAGNYVIDVIVNYKDRSYNGHVNITVSTN